MVKKSHTSMQALPKLSPSQADRMRKLVPAEVIAHYDGTLPPAMTLQAAVDILAASMPALDSLSLLAMVDVKRADQIAAQHLAWACIQSHLSGAKA